MAGTGVSVASGDLTPLLDDNGSGVYSKGRNNSRDIRVGLIGSSFLVGSDGFTPRPGVLVRTTDSSDLQVQPAVSPNQTVTIKKGISIVPRTGQGAYLFVNEADQIVNMPAASNVNSRYDIVCCAAFDKGAFVGDTAHGPQFWVESGAVSGSPVVPATPAGMLKLAEVLRATNDNTIALGEIADKRTSTSLHVPARVLLPGDSAATAGLVLGEMRQGGTGPEFWNGTVWCPVGRNSFVNIASIPASLAVTNMLVYHAGLKRMIRFDGTNWDQNYDVDNTILEAAQTSDQVFASATDLVGASKTFTVVNPNTVALVTTTFDAGVSTGFFNGQLIVDGSAHVREAHGGNISRGTCSQTYRIPLSAGSHTLKLRGTFSAATGTCYGTHTTIVITLTDR
jgi:hypothetical protein